MNNAGTERYNKGNKQKLTKEITYIRLASSEYTRRYAQWRSRIATLHQRPCRLLESLVHYPYLDRSRPGALHLVLQIIAIRFSARRPPNGRVGEVHVRGHGARIRGPASFGIEVGCRARRRDAGMRRGRPTEAGHVRASANAIGPVVVIGGRLKRLRRTVSRRMGSHRGTGVRSATITGQRWGRGGRGSPGTGLRETAANMGRNRSVRHVVVGARHIQRGKVASWGNRVVCRRGSGMDRAVVGEHVTRHSRSLLVLPQIGLGFRSSFLDCARVVVLVACQGSAASECLLAVRVGALVGTLPRVDSAVSRQRGRITERLQVG